MRILMVNNEFPPLGGGTGSVNYAVLQRLTGVPGVEVDLITSALGRQPEESRFAERIRIFKVPVDNRILHHSSNRELILFSLRALPLARRLQRKKHYDFCFAWAGVPAGGVALALRQLTDLRYLVRVSGPDIPGFELRYRQIYPILTPFIRAIWQRAQVVVAKCEGEAEMIRAVDPRVKISLVPNGVDLDVFQPHTPIQNQGPLRLICVARLIERKGQNHLIQAVKRLTDEGLQVSLDLVGTGDAQVTYRQQARILGIEKQVNFCGYVPREKIAAHYGAAHVFVLPSYNEGMSVATLEAMAAGLALVVTRTGGAANLVREGVNGWMFPWADVETLTAHLRRLATDRTLVRQMGAASRDLARQFSWDKVVKQYLELFARMTASCY